MGKTRHPKNPAVAYNIEEWMWGLDGESQGEPKQNDDTNHRLDQHSDHSQWRSWHQRRHMQQRVPWLPRKPSKGSPSLGGNSFDGQSEWSSRHSNQTRVSQQSIQSGWTGRGFRVKVSLPTFKDEKAKDTVTYCSWWWDMSMFCCSGLDNCHLLPYVFRSLQSFPGDLVRSLGEDATLCNVLQMLDEHYGVMITFDALCKELYSLKWEWERMWLSLEYTYPNKFRYFRQSIPAESNRNMWRKWSGIASIKALVLSIRECWPTRAMVKILSPILNCSLLPKSWKDGWKPEILCSWKPLLLGVWK